jgi:hypothetical protein
VRSILELDPDGKAPKGRWRQPDKVMLAMDSLADEERSPERVRPVAVPSPGALCVCLSDCPDHGIEAFRLALGDNDAAIAMMQAIPEQPELRHILNCDF